MDILPQESMIKIDMADQDLLHIPEELLSDILNRLPVKSLIRFTAVCKSWKSFITSPRFINTHRLANTVKNRVFMRHRCKNGFDKYSIYRDDDTFEELSHFSSPFLHSISNRIVSSCNGLICIYVYRNTQDVWNVYLWNPTIRRLIRVPKSRYGWGTIGFGFVSQTNDYKVVNINGGSETGRDSVYELETGSWKDVCDSDDLLSEYHVAVDSTQCCLNDTIHWEAGINKLNWRGGINKFDGVIVTFDMEKNEFGVMTVPSIIDRNSFDVRMIMFQDSLALVQSSKEEQRSVNFSIWVMKEYGVSDSWSKHITVDLTYSFFKDLQVFNYMSDDPLLATFSMNHRAPMRYYSSFGNLDIDKKDNYAHYFVPSLALFGKPKSFSQDLFRLRRTLEQV